jgi:hypothetical protein
MNRKRLNEMKDEALYNRVNELKGLIKIHEDYLKCSFGTFLGPLGANAEIKRCKKELQKVYNELNERGLLY